MVVEVESRAAGVTGGKTAARGCDVCMKRSSRASWFCPADDAFLCQSCDASIHSANSLAKRHERVRLQSPSSPELLMKTKATDKTTSVWYEGFRRKARTPRSKLLQIQDVNNSNDPLVPELGVEEEEGVFSFSSTDENEESLNCCVPVFDPFSDMVIDDNSFGLVPDGVDITTSSGDLGEIEKAIMDDDEGLIGFLPFDMDLGEIFMDVESLLEEEHPFLRVKELNSSSALVKEETNVGFEFDSKDLKRVKDEEEEEVKCEHGGSDQETCEDEDRKASLFLRLDYEAVISAWDNHGSPWETGIKPEFNLDCCLLGGNNTCPSHVMGGFDELESAVGSVTRQQGRDGGGSDVEREARVLRYRDKRRTRLFAKKIRYEVRKLNAEQRPRIKGRFVKRTSLNFDVL
ncbi:PREDICTED: zinc finger protein CONSTANS-LIKE 7 [Camelina sativa]|uniref:Zinc finger protein CONSTANS-LIKE 7 n=1 Tax=Camelina sativa TaxID=90675 RepID=A0ABM0WIA1_CAMSA|nr:PREDICTED: zinc finger protein CONSTANS-LIKE 7 [Camelina sativa]